MKNEKKAIRLAEKRWQDIKSGKSQTTSSSEFWKNQEITTLEKRWEKYLSGKMKFHTSEEMQNKVFKK